jgi:predicted glycogen debranching enzyme
VAGNERIGGFASSTIWGMNTRRYHALLTAATRPPLGRMVLLSKLEEAAVIDGERFELLANRYPGVLHPRRFEYMRISDWIRFQFFATKSAKSKLRRRFSWCMVKTCQSYSTAFWVIACAH